MTAKRISIYVGAPLETALLAVESADDSGSRSGRINTIAERYMEIVRRCTPGLAEDEWSALIDAQNGTVHDVNGLRCMEYNLLDSPELAAKWGVDTAALTAKIAAMPFQTRAAVAEVMERYWAQEPGDQRQRLAKAGAIVV